MAYVEYNPNPCGRRVGDCAVRALSKALGMGWESTHLMLDVNAISMGDMPSADAVLGATLRQHGYYKHLVKDYRTVEDFCEVHPKGIYVLFLGGHVVTCVDGDHFDSWDSGKETIEFYWSKQEVEE